MNKIKTLFDISPELETSEPQESRITLNEITLLSKMQAVTRYNPVSYTHLTLPTIRLV